MIVKLRWRGRILLCVAFAFVLLGERPLEAAEPTVSTIGTALRGNEHVSLVDVTFALADTDGDNCHLFVFGHNAATREYTPMGHFVEGRVFGQT